MNSLTTIANRHDFTDTFTAEYSMDTDSIEIISPSTDKRLVITGVYISSEMANESGQKIRIHFANNTVATFFPPTSDLMPVLIQDFIIKGDKNESLKLTSDIGDENNYFLSINYREEI